MDDTKLSALHAGSAGVCCASRRSFLGGMAALGAGALLLGERAAAQGGAGNPRRIDVHHHFTPPAYLEYTRTYNRGRVPVDAEVAAAPLRLLRLRQPWAAGAAVRIRDGFLNKISTTWIRTGRRRRFSR